MSELPSAPSSSPQATSPAPATNMQEPEIHVIPEKFYGAAAQAKVAERGAAMPGVIAPPKKKSGRVIALVVLVLILGSGGAFVYFNQSLLFPPKTETPTTPPPPPPPPEPPTAPSNLSATSTNSRSVTLTWTDTSQKETGFRIERAEGITGTFISLTNLQQNSASFLDVSVQPGKSYRYRVIATSGVGDSPASSDASASVAALPPPPPESPKLPPAGLDSDSDGLTDLEETLFGTDSRTPDKDFDGFLDGNEVFHLYNPNGQAPARLLDAKLVNIVSGDIGWSIQVPTGWKTTVVGGGSSATILSGHGETFDLSIEDNPTQLSIVDWYMKKNPEVQKTNILEYRSKRGYQGIIGADLLTTYIPWGSKVFVFRYKLDNQPFINYRTTYSMMLNSLELKGLPQISVPTTNEPLPFEPAATATGVVTQPVPIEATSTVGGSSTSSASVTSTP